MAALNAEGLRVHTGHTQPVYRNPIFQEMNFGRTGHPFTCSFYGKEIDYRTVYLPETERIYAEEALCLPHATFLGPQSDMDRILDVLHKLAQQSGRTPRLGTRAADRGCVHLGRLRQFYRAGYTRN